MIKITKTYQQGHRELFALFISAYVGDWTQHLWTADAGAPSLQKDESRDEVLNFNMVKGQVARICEGNLAGEYVKVTRCTIEYLFVVSYL